MGKSYQNGEKMQIENGDRRNFVMIPNSIVRGRHNPRFVMVLLSIASHAGFSGECWASTSTIIEEIGIKRDSVFRAIKYWEDLGILIVERVAGETSKIKTALDFTNDQSQTGDGLSGNQSQTGDGSSRKRGTGVVANGGHKEESIEEESKKKISRVAARPAATPPPDSKGAEVNQIFAVFHDTINPRINFGQKTWRNAAEELLKEYGLERILSITKFACEVQGQPYAPLITNPYQLREKLSALQIFYKKAQQPQKGAIQSL
jgi:hypothetical protein